MSLGLALVVRGFVLPALAASAAYLVASRSLRAGGGTWASILALTAAYAVGHAGLLGWPPLPPREAMHWIFWAALATAALALREALLPTTKAARWAWRAALFAAGLRALLDPYVAHTWGSSSGWLRVAGLTGLALIACFGLERAAARTSALTWTTWLAAFLMTAAAAISLALTGSLALGQLAGALAAGLGVTVAAAAVFRAPALSHAGGLVPAWIVTGLVLTGYFYSSLPASTAALVAIAPYACLLVPSRSLDDPPRARTALLRTAPLLLPLGAAVLLAALAGSAYEY